MLGKFKDETGSIPITSFIGLRAKMYSYHFHDCVVRREKKTAKGTLKRSVSNKLFRTLKRSVSNKLTFDKYAQVLNYPTNLYLRSNLIQSKRHEIFTSLINKLALCPYEDKRFILPNEMDTLPHGHYLIPFLKTLLKDVWHS